MGRVFCVQMLIGSKLPTLMGTSYIYRWNLLKMRNFKTISQSSTRKGIYRGRRLFMFFKRHRILSKCLMGELDRINLGLLLLLLLSNKCVSYHVGILHIVCFYNYEIYFSKNNDDNIIIHLLYYCADCLYWAENRFQNSL